MKTLKPAENRMIVKLRSETGASISFALLLFLVCASLCAVILVAATVSAGRVSRIAEADQEYYAVVSAAEFLVDSMDEKTVSVVTISGSGSDSRTKTFHKAMNQITDADFTTEVSLPTEEVNPDPDIQHTQAADYDSAVYTMAEDTAEYYTQSNHGDSRTITLKSSKENEAFTVNMEEKVDKNTGTVTFTISKPDKSGKTGKQHYKMQVVFSMEDMEKTPPLTQVEYYKDLDETEDTTEIVRKVTDAHEVTLHLKSMMTPYDANTGNS